MTESESIQQLDGACVRYRGRKLSYFAGCDYFRLSRHPEVLRAIKAGLDKYGLNVAASRITTGNHHLYGDLEKALAGFFRARAALVASNGYATNAMVAQAARGQFSHVFIDAKAHVSLRDASRLFGCPVLDFRSRDPASLRRVLREHKSHRPIVLTDGVYTYEGAVAPVRDYLKMVGPRGMILLDDAHGAGVIGRTGRGTVEFCGVARDRVIQTVTLSKAFGVYGGAILCSKALREQIVARSAMFAGSTPLPLPLVTGALRAIRILTEGGSLRRRLEANVNYAKKRFQAAGVAVTLNPVPVVAITPATPAHDTSLRKSLLARRIFPSFIKYPGGPAGGYLRIVISSEHTRRQLDNLLEAVAEADV